MEVKFSGSRWRQIERGYRRDSDSQVTAPHATLAHMAWVVGIDSTRLAETGRTQAADILRELERSKAPAPSPAPEAGPLAQLEEWQQKVILNALDERPRSAQEKALLLRTLAAQIEAEAARQGATDAPLARETPGRSTS
ncbi:hypothetical protein [Streptomyces sp. NPDC051452]|uniref:hypothetical protein n=1 Tax=Streptomyces sp. NPDC051452 TaxID=3365654 RepID=UPI0037924A23